MNIEDFEVELESAIADLENLATKAPEPFKKQMESPLTALTVIKENVWNAVDEGSEQP